jgi:hypothetical protein
MWIVGVIVIVLVSLVTLFLVWLDQSVEREIGRELKTLGDAPCPCCGDAYGMDTARQARQDYLTRREETRRERPGLLTNFARFWQVQCPRCGAPVQFYFESARLVATDVPVAGE